MILKIFGAILVVAACAGCGFLMSISHQREVIAIRQLIAAIDYMECELQYRLTPLPQLCRQAAGVCEGAVSKVFMELANELDNQISPDAEFCMESALAKINEIPDRARNGLVLLGRTLGRFDVEGQVQDLKAVQNECIRHLEAYTHNEDTRLRSYRTLGLCAGIAVVIILI